MTIMQIENPNTSSLLAYQQYYGKCYIKSGLKCSMPPDWNVYNQFVIQYKHILAHTYKYKSIHTDTYSNT